MVIEVTLRDLYGDGKLFKGVEFPACIQVKSLFVLNHLFIFIPFVCLSLQFREQLNIINSSLFSSQYLELYSIRQNFLNYLVYVLDRPLSDYTFGDVKDVRADNYCKGSSEKLKLKGKIQ